jgi:hypothetical protein
MKIRRVVLAATITLLCSFASLASAQDGVLQARGPIWIAMPSSSGRLQSITVKAPANGNMIVTMTGTVNYNHTLGTEGFWCLTLSKTSGDTGGCVPMAGSDSAIRSYFSTGDSTTVPGFGASQPYSIVRTWPVTAGTTYTFYLNGYINGLGSTYLFQPSATAVFVTGTLIP